MVLIETKDVNVELFNIITRIDEAKTLAKHILYDYTCKFDSATCNSNQKWNNVNMSVKIIARTKKIIVVIVAHVFVRTVGI